MEFNRIKYLLICLTAIYITGCEEANYGRLLSSAGEVDEVLVVLDDEFKDSEISDTLFHFFTEDFPGLPQNEPQFVPRIKTIKQFNTSGDLLKKYRVIIFFSSMEPGSKVFRVSNSALGEEEAQKSLKDSDFLFETKENVYAAPQLVVYLFAPTMDELLHRFIEHRQKLFTTIASYEKKKISKSFYITGHNQMLEKKIKDKFGLSISIPANFGIVEEGDDFAWFGAERIVSDKHNVVTNQISQFVVIQTFPADIKINYESDQLDSVGFQTLPFALRDSMGKAHIQGDNEKEGMYTDLIRPLYQRQVKINGDVYIESRGLWRLDNPIMGGPFLNYMALDKQNNRIIVIDGFIFAAGMEKRPLVREFETLFSSLKQSSSNETGS